MQEKIQIISDGSLDLSRELTRECDILVVPFYVSFDGETYMKEGVELDIREFYQRMVDHPDVFPKTSMPSVDDYYQVFLPLAKQDVPMICICITTKFSGSMQSATTQRSTRCCRACMYLRHAGCATSAGSMTAWWRGSLP